MQIWDGPLGSRAFFEDLPLLWQWKIVEGSWSWNPTQSSRWPRTSKVICTYGTGSFILYGCCTILYKQKPPALFVFYGVHLIFYEPCIASVSEKLWCLIEVKVEKSKPAPQGHPGHPWHGHSSSSSVHSASKHKDKSIWDAEDAEGYCHWWCRRCLRCSRSLPMHLSQFPPKPFLLDHSPPFWAELLGRRPPGLAWPSPTQVLQHFGRSLRGIGLGELFFFSGFLASKVAKYPRDQTTVWLHRNHFHQTFGMRT